ncbi:MAG: RND family transporter [Bauldia sp.]
MKEKSSPSFGLGVLHVGRLVYGHPRIAGVLLAIIVGLSIYGIFGLSVDRDLRDMFRGESEAYRTYVAMTDAFADPENQLIVLVEGDAIREPATLQRLLDFQFELTLLDGAGSVYSLFSLRTPPDAEGQTQALVAEPSAGLTPELIASIRAHPIAGQSLLSADGSAMVFVVTHSEPKATLDQHNELIAGIDDLVATQLASSGLEVTLTGFAALRTEIVALLKRDQLVLNGSGGIIGLVLSLILFRSIVGAIMTAAPAAMGALLIIGFNGLFGVPVTILSNVVPALIMVIGYADGMHLTSAFRRYRQEGNDFRKAEWLSFVEVGPACMLSALATIVAFLSMFFSNVQILRDFALVGSIGTFFGTWMVLVGHLIVTRLIGRYWKVGEDAPVNILDRAARPVADLTNFVAKHAKPIAAIVVPLTIVFGACLLLVPPEHSVRETLPRGSAASQALNVVDQELGGAFPIQVVVPMDGLDPLSPEGLARIRAVHEAVGAVDGVSRPLSLWSLAAWLGDGAAPVEERLATLVNQLPDETLSRLLGAPGAMVTVNIGEMPTAETAAIIDDVEAAAHAAVPESIVTGSTVVNAREATRTIRQLTINFGEAIVVAILLMALVMKSLGVGIVAIIPNLLPITATGTILLLLGTGMQITSVLSLTLAFGIAVDDTIHFLNLFLRDRKGTVRERLVRTAHHIGPVLLGTTLVIVVGLSMTLTSGLVTVAQFGLLTMATLTIAMLGDLIVLPALIAGPLKRFFRTDADNEPATAADPVRRETEEA